MEQEQPELLYSIVEVCAKLKVSRPTVYELINTRQLATIKIGRRRLVAHDDLLAFVSSQRRIGV